MKIRILLLFVTFLSSAHAFHQEEMYQKGVVCNGETCQGETCQGAFYNEVVYKEEENLIDQKGVGADVIETHVAPDLDEETKSTVYNAFIAEDVWAQVEPYLLPETHTVKPFLDKICSKMRIVSSVDVLEKAGFTIVSQQIKKGLIVAKHPKLAGYLLKLYLDSCPRKEWSLWVVRAKGARVIQELLDKYDYNRYMKVPMKWIYPLTDLNRPEASGMTFPKDFILVVQDMKLVSDRYNLHCYANSMTFPRLEALYRMIKEGGLSDSHVKNIPFSVDHKIAFIDTEYVNIWPVHHDWLTKYFSPRYQSFWLKLLQKK